MMTPNEPDATVWRKSSYSGNGEACVEIAPTPAGVLLRDSKNPIGPTLVVPTPHWRRFLSSFSG